MAFEITKTTEEQNTRAVEIGIQLAGLGRKKAAIQTERALAENGWNKRLAEIAAQERILGDELSDMGETVVSEK